MNLTLILLLMFGTHTIELIGPGNGGSTFLAFFATHRSPEVRRQFQHLHPCPSTGRKYGACPGYIADHRIPLCKGGPDAVWNLHWQTVAAAKAKDKWECK